MKCYCHVDGFIEHCRSLDKNFNELPDLYSKFKSTKRNDKIKVNNTGLSIATDLNILCQSCNATGSVPAATTKFQDINMKGKYTLHKKSHRYQLNVKLTLGAIASGIGPTNLAQLLLFIDLPNVKTVNGRFFRNMELIVEPILRKVGAKAMEEASEEEIRLTLGSEEKFKNGKKGTYLCR